MRVAACSLLLLSRVRNANGVSFIEPANGRFMPAECQAAIASVRGFFAVDRRGMNAN
jgi:hypothetical protein